MSVSCLPPIWFTIHCEFGSDPRPSLEVRGPFVSTRAPFHMVFLFKLPSFSAVMTFLAAPDEGGRLDVIERPTDWSAVGIYAAKHDTVTYRPSLNSHDVVELRAYEDYAPLFKSSIEEADRCPYATILLPLCRVGEKDVLHRATIKNPAHQQFAFFMSNAAIIEVEAIVAVPCPHEAVKYLRLISQRRIGARGCKRLDHVPSRISTLRSRVPKHERQRACCCDRAQNCATRSAN